jgi:hypothetical protein
MRGVLATAAVLVFAACGPGTFPHQFTAAAPEQAFECVARHAGTLGYRVTSQTPTEVRVERDNDRLWVLNLLGINDTVDVLIASTGEAPNQLSIGGFSQIIRAGERQSAAPSREVRRDAQEIIGACS